MTRAAFFISLAVSAAAVAQQPPPLPLPAAPKKEEKKKKEAPPPPLPLPGLDAPAAKKDATPAPAPLPLPLPLPAAPSSTAQKAAPAAAPAAPPKAAPAVDTTRAVQANKQPPPTAPPAALAIPVARPADLRLRSDPTANLWTIRAFAGGERSVEQDYTAASTITHLAAEGTRWFAGSWLARGQLDWRASKQTYVPLHGTTGVGVDENRFDVIAGVGYDVGTRLVENGRLELTPMVGVHYAGLRNDAFNSDLFGPEFGGRVRYALSSSVTVHAQASYVYNLTTASDPNSALKAAKGDVNLRAGLALPLSGGYAVEFDYSGDVLAFENTYRTAHGAALGFGTTF